MSKTSETRKPRYFVVAIDDGGRYYFGRLFRTPLIAAKSVASVVDGVDAEAFALSWNASNESGSCRYEIGVEE